MTELILSEYKKQIGGRTEGDLFLKNVLWPIIEERWIRNHEQIKINFNNVEFLPGFLDQLFVKLICEHEFKDSKDCFILTSDNPNIIAEVMSAIIGAEMKTFNKPYSL